MIHRVLPITLLLFASRHATAADRPAPAPQTVAEASDFRATSSFDETLDYIRELAAKSPAIRLEFFGESAEGTPLPLVVAASADAQTPSAAAGSGRPIVMIQNGIHAGEIDGKDASLMLLRELAQGAEPLLLERLVLLVVPIYNVDGHERVSPYNRPNQDGPQDGMGFRTTSDGHDLNRDHLKLETPEARAMIRLFNTWRPHLHVDNHVTDGSDHDWVLTYAWAEAPQLALSVDAWLGARLPRVIEATQALGHRLGPYVSLLDPLDPEKGFESLAAEPRFATGYYPLRQRPSILVETHSYKPYRDRVRANHDFLLSLLREVAREPQALVAAVTAAEARTVALGKPAAPPSTVTLRYRRAAADKARFPVYDWYQEPSVVVEGPLLRYRRGVVHEVEVPWVHRLEPELSVARPRGYLVLPGWPAIEERLRAHGLRVLSLDATAELEVETLRLTLPPSRETYQGLARIEPLVTRSTERRRVPFGTLWVPADQPDFEVAVQLLEPEAPDSLVSWGLLSIVAERKEYIDARVLEDLARAQLERPEVREAWREALEQPGFAQDRQARIEWWWRRTPYWDDTVGLLPVLRVMSLPALPLHAAAR